MLSKEENYNRKYMSFVTRMLSLYPACRPIHDRALIKMTSRLIISRLLSLPMIYGAQLSPDVRYRYESIAREISVYVSPSSSSEKKRRLIRKRRISFSCSSRFPAFSPPVVLLSSAEIYEQIRYIAGYYSLDAIKEI